MRTWDDTYPDKARLRLEISVMRESILEALLELTEPGNLEGVYAKGSSLKAWDNPIDYVPELSDVDIQVLLKDDTWYEHLPNALEFQSRMERRFRQRAPSPLHLPRPQLQLLRSRLQHYSPSHGVQTLHGLPYEELRPRFGKPNHPDTDRQMLLEPEAFLAGVFDSAMDRPGKYLFDVLRQLGWRVGPTGPRVLSVLGLDFEAAWGGNRTHIYGKLRELGQTNLAENYAAFYLNACDFFRSGYQNTDAAREAVRAGVGVLESGLGIGRTVSVRPTSTPSE